MHLPYMLACLCLACYMLACLQMLPHSTSRTCLTCYMLACLQVLPAGEHGASVRRRLPQQAADRLALLPRLVSTSGHHLAAAILTVETVYNICTYTTPCYQDSGSQSRAGAGARERLGHVEE